MNGIRYENENPKRFTRFRCDFGIAESFVNILIWIVLSIITFGLALLFFPYFLNKSVLNKTYILNQNGQVVGHLRCNYSIPSSIGNAILWGILILITFGLASFFYVYRVIKVVLDETFIEYY